ncbi:hypothetical protein BKA82DRAFT_1007188 [Pisolithus tinctorius]|uniref:Uncharacterized protein n=1 Tax=Pisolithus tinctorius Marx 270 TaxID=870435 RepID=A0A0C3NKG4_PISTI|nr:hypothetical protein BKA82DRAFT_1007188 [Pisolithus tinctorius]KIN95813.1 hypothetical protein M404DRAFT_1007188 [Pisolithus tinctorius Marx 270]
MVISPQTKAPSSPFASLRNRWLGIENRLANKEGNNSTRSGYTFSTLFCRSIALQEPELIAYLWRIGQLLRLSGTYLA